MDAEATRRVLGEAARRLGGRAGPAPATTKSSATPWNVVRALTQTIEAKARIETLLAEPDDDKPGGGPKPTAPLPVVAADTEVQS